MIGAHWPILHLSDHKIGIYLATSHWLLQGLYDTSGPAHSAQNTGGRDKAGLASHLTEQKGVRAEAGASLLLTSVSLPNSPTSQEPASQTRSLGKGWPS